MIEKTNKNIVFILGGLFGVFAFGAMTAYAAGFLSDSGLGFPDGSIQTTAAVNGVNYSPTILGIAWQNTYLTASPAYEYMGNHPCGAAQVVTLSAGNGVSDTSKGAIIHIYSMDSDERSPGVKVYDMAGNVMGVVGQSGRGGDGQSYGIGGDIMTKLTNRQFQVRLCRRDGVGATVWFAAKGVIN